MLLEAEIIDSVFYVSPHDYIYTYIYTYIYINIYVYICIYVLSPQRSTIFGFLLMSKMVGNLLQKQSKHTITFKKNERIPRSENTSFLEGSNLF